MSSRELEERHIAALFGHVLNFLRFSPLAAPDRQEREPTYTSRCLQSPIADLLEQLDIRGLVRSGDGAAAVRTVNLLGLPFYPDLAISFHAMPLVAVEVKFLRGTARQNPIVTAAGQALLYRMLGYRHSCIFLVDVANQARVEDILRAQDAMEGMGIPLIVRRKRGSALLAHPSPA